MVVSVSFEKRVPPGSAKRGTLAELMAKQKAQSELRNQAMQEETPTIMQGLGKLGNVLGAAWGERRAEREEMAGRDELARLKAQIGFGEGTPEQLAQIGTYDPDLENTMRKEALEARQEAARQQAVIDAREDEQTFRSGESKLERDARLASEAETRNVTIRGQDIDVTQGRESTETTRRGQDIDVEQGAATLAQQKARDDAAAAAETQRLEIEKAKAEADAGKPTGPLGQMMYDVKLYNEGKLGDKTDPNVQAAFKATLAKNTALTKGMQITMDKDGNFSFSEGGVEGGNAFDSNAGKTAIVQSIDEYRADAKAANSALTDVQNASKVVGSAGYTGPGQGIYGAVDDALEGVGSMFGAKAGETSVFGVGASLPGTASAREQLAKGGLSQVLQRVQQTKGAISDAEMSLFKQASFGLDKTPESNALAADMAIAIIERANMRAARAEAWFKTHGNMQGFESQEWLPFLQANPLISIDDNGKPVLNKAGGPAPAAPTDTAAPVAPAAPAGAEPDISKMNDAELDAYEAELKKRQGR